MPLFPQDLLADLRALPGARHSFLRQLAEDDGAAHRAWLQTAVDAVGGPVKLRWTDVLGSLDNQRFFQGWSEVATTAALSASGWKVHDLAWPGPSLTARAPGGERYQVMVLSFVRQTRPADQQALQRLTAALDRVGSRSRIVVLVRRWLPHDFDPEPVRRAIDMWLREVDRAGWEGRYAEYRDDHISLEFALTGEQARDDQGVVALMLGPFDAHRVLETVERRLVCDLDAQRLSAWSDEPVIVSLVCDQPWRLPRGYLRELLYGKPISQQTVSAAPGGSGDGPVAYRATFGPEYTPSLFRDPLYSGVSGVVMLERRVDQPDPVVARSWLNPWASRPLAAAHLPGRTFAPIDRDGEHPVMGWID
ncbi:MAG: hypothetical protein H6742_10880 [Alphaproteobacteria bacterium]|nr:hypothetical protein [Alphaproteobacteria bacterium]